MNIRDGFLTDYEAFRIMKDIQEALSGAPAGTIALHVAVAVNNASAAKMAWRIVDWMSSNPEWNDVGLLEADLIDDGIERPEVSA